jgi:hypothetical protein
MQREGEAKSVGQGIATETVLLFVVGWEEVADRRRYIDVLQSRNTKDGRSRLCEGPRRVKVGRRGKKRIDNASRPDCVSMQKGREEKKRDPLEHNPYPQRSETKTEGGNETLISDKKPPCPSCICKEANSRELTDSLIRTPGGGIRKTISPSIMTHAAMQKRVQTLTELESARNSRRDVNRRNRENGLQLQLQRTGAAGIAWWSPRLIWLL